MGSQLVKSISSLSSLIMKNKEQIEAYLNELSFSDLINMRNDVSFKAQIHSNPNLSQYYTKCHIHLNEVIEQRIQDIFGKQL